MKWCRGQSQVTKKSPKDVSTTTTLLSNHSMVPKCSYCCQAHPSSSCRLVTNRAERKQLLQQTGHCFVCLWKNHHTSCACHSTIKCGKCGRSIMPAYVVTVTLKVHLPMRSSEEVTVTVIVHLMMVFSVIIKTSIDDQTCQLQLVSFPQQVWLFPLLPHYFFAEKQG